MMNDGSYNHREEPGTSCERRIKQPVVNAKKRNSFLLQEEKSVHATPSTMHRVTSLTENEKSALISLLIDPTLTNHHENSRNLTKDILLSTPYYPATCEVLNWNNHDDGNSSTRASSKRKFQQRRRRNSKHHVGLWKAHETGLLRKVIQKGSSLFGKGVTTSSPIPAVVPPPSPSPFFPHQQVQSGTKNHANADMKSTVFNNQQSDSSMASSTSGFDSSATAERTDISQCEVRPDRDDGSGSSASTWDDSPAEHFDAWEVMNDEYAEEFGFNYDPYVQSLDQEDRQTFQILGTSANDLTAQPHVLSPPLMESLMNFLPESLSADNWWLKYSLVRDGASLDTMQNYTRAAEYTVIAIQTTKGDVFGSFNTAPWQVGRNYVGSGESFVWKMRNTRARPCSCLYEQAHMESEVDVYPSSRLNSCYQLCTRKFLGVGSGEIDAERMRSEAFSEQIFSNAQEQLELGFAFALHDDLQQGTSSPSGTYLNPKLTGSHDGIFEVCNLEVWTFTPCVVVDDAENLEMTKHFLREKVINSSISSIASYESPASPSSSQSLFYRRLGEND